MKRLSFLLLAISMTLFACRQASDKLIEKVFVVNISPGEKALQEYLQYHENVWPEVEAGFRKAGFKSITLYHYDHLLVMTFTVPENSDLAAMGKLAESYSPKFAEWNKLMNSYQTGIPGTKPGETWTEARPFYKFRN